LLVFFAPWGHNPILKVEFLVFLGVLVCLRALFVLLSSSLASFRFSGEGERVGEVIGLYTIHSVGGISKVVSLTVRIGVNLVVGHVALVLVPFLMIGCGFGLLLEFFLIMFEFVLNDCF